MLDVDNKKHSTLKTWTLIAQWLASKLAIGGEPGLIPDAIKDSPSTVGYTYLWCLNPDDSSVRYR